jgi:hypothetical protein
MYSESTRSSHRQAKEVHVFTSAALNYLPKVRTLFSSIRRHHPDWKLHFLVADEVNLEEGNDPQPQPDQASRPEAATLDLSQEPFDSAVSVRDLGIPDWQAWSFCHSLTELATAIKPFMLEGLLAASQPNDIVFYFDPDIVIFSPLDDLCRSLDRASIVLTPHQVTAEEGLAAIIDNEIGSLKHGVYNLGFIGVRNCDQGKKFASWWAKRCYFFCRDDIANGLFTDQRWIDLVPGMFAEVEILRNKRFNVATWNITTRALSQDEHGLFFIEDQPLGFYHFTGFDSGSHRIMAAKNGEDNQSLENLIRWYENQLSVFSKDLGKAPAWSFNCFSNGEAIVKEQRELYRFRGDLQKAFPDPYEQDGYLKWWRNRGADDYAAYKLRRSQPHFYITPGFLGSYANGYSPTRLVDLLQRIRRLPRSAAPSVKHGLRLGRQVVLPGLLQKWRRKLSRIIG